MNVDVSILLSSLSVLIAGVACVFSIARGRKTDTAEEVSQLATVITKLDAMSLDIGEIKRDFRELRSASGDHAERIVRLEQQMKVINKEIFEKGAK